MSRLKSVDENSVCQRLNALSKLVEPKTSAQLAMEFGVSEDQIKLDIEVMKTYGVHLQSEEIGQDLWVIPADVNEGVTINFNQMEWSQLNEMVEEALTLPEMSKFHSFLGEFRKQYTFFSEFDQLVRESTNVENIDPEKNRFVQFIEEAIITRSLIHIDIKDGKKKVIYPIKVIHLEGSLSMIGEDSHDHCLVVMSTSDLKRVKVLAQPYRPQVTPYELEEFISAVRNMNEKETRLILKIHDPESVNLLPNHHFLGKPCMITNPTGDLIWAAYVEPCAALYDWLIELGKKVEILDPVQFKSEYLGYCEEKLSKIA